MKKFQLLIALSIVSCLTIQAQDYTNSFGKVSLSEIEINEYPLDKDAEAVVLFDIGKSVFLEKNNSFELEFERTSRIKIFSEAGIEWAKIEIPFYQEGRIYEKVYDIVAYTYNLENGIIKKTPLNLSNSYEEKLNDSWDVLKFALPDVKAGSIIEYTYKISSQYLFNLRDWEFQWKIPVKYSEYEVKMIPFYSYSWILQGATKFDSQTSNIDKSLSRQFGHIVFQDMVHNYIMKDIPAFKGEEFITSINDYIIKIDFQLSKITNLDGSVVNILSSFEEMIKDLEKHPDFGKYVKKAEKLSTKLIDVKNLLNKSETERFNYVLDFAKNNYRWDKNNRKYAEKSPNKFIDEKNGNSAELNLFTIGMLNSVGIESYPVIVSTRNNGKIQLNSPYTHFFNYVIILANVGGEIILSDATDNLSLNSRIPTRCLNDKGLIIKRDEVGWVDLECLIPSKLNTELELELTDSGDLNGLIKKTSTEYFALNFRKNYADNIEHIIKKLDAKNYTIIDSTISVENQLDREKPYVLSYKLSSKAETINDKIYLKPFFDELISDNPLKQKSRTYPIDMVYPEKKTFKSTITIPEGYQVEFMPELQKIENSLFDLNYSILNDGKKIILSFDYYFKKAIYSAKDYSRIKFYFNEIVKRGNEKIVFSKIAETE